MSPDMRRGIFIGFHVGLLVALTVVVTILTLARVFT